MYNIISEKLFHERRSKHEYSYQNVFNFAIEVNTKRI